MHLGISGRHRMAEEFMRILNFDLGGTGNLRPHSCPRGKAKDCRRPRTGLPAYLSFCRDIPGGVEDYPTNYLALPPAEILRFRRREKSGEAGPP